MNKSDQKNEKRKICLEKEIKNHFQVRGERILSCKELIEN